jgi:hypothetical protein
MSDADMTWWMWILAFLVWLAIEWVLFRLLTGDWLGRLNR